MSMLIFAIADLYQRYKANIETKNQKKRSSSNLRSTFDDGTRSPFEQIALAQIKSDSESNIIHENNQNPKELFIDTNTYEQQQLQEGETSNTNQNINDLSFNKDALEYVLEQQNEVKDSESIQNQEFNKDLSINDFQQYAKPDEKIKRSSSQSKLLKTFLRRNQQKSQIIYNQKTVITEPPGQAQINPIINQKQRQLPLKTYRNRNFIAGESNTSNVLQSNEKQESKSEEYKLYKKLQRQKQEAINHSISHQRVKEDKMLRQELENEERQKLEEKRELSIKKKQEQSLKIAQQQNQYKLKILEEVSKLKFEKLENRQKLFEQKLINQHQNHIVRQRLAYILRFGQDRTNQNECRVTSKLRIISGLTTLADVIKINGTLIKQNKKLIIY
ncbi:UNKNOWN [Stylonychia lemnae]|uniref:Uncharacterized protein n=1 Tax=Stylonychia lemnae TaxID=5949 RepID=A0A078AQB0_STYLE|nr:UNKNOWN [Stylonychia lemnae]|eukprot:CDW83432.1 UNKNOWN [Stylonychia lemnae]